MVTAIGLPNHQGQLLLSLFIFILLLQNSGLLLPRFLPKCRLILHLIPLLRSLIKKTSPKRLPLQFWIVASIAFINSVSFTIIIPVLYPYAKDFGLSDFQASFIDHGLFAIAVFWGRLY